MEPGTTAAGQEHRLCAHDGEIVQGLLPAGDKQWFVRLATSLRPCSPVQGYLHEGHISLVEAAR
jgi:hypothetical protein